MSSPVRAAMYVALIALLALAARQVAPGPAVVRAGDDGGAMYRLDDAAADRARVPLLDATTRAAPLRFAAEASPREQSYVLAAVAGARPEARRLIDLVDGLATVRFGAVSRAGAIGLTSFDGKRFDITIDFEALSRRHGINALNATILHELGHVVDRAIVPDELAARLDAEIPTGINCIPGRSTSTCPPIEERFADTFARWAMDDISINGTVGYRILPPVPVAAWGRPLAELAGM